jgi:tetratricopeptide (TPR) repeat protein
VPDYKKIPKKPDKTKVLLQLAVKHMDAGKYDPAESVLSELLSAQPGDPEVCRLLALVHLRRGELTVAKGEIKFLAAAAMRAQDYDLAESLIREYLDADPDCVALLELLGRSYEEKGDHASAIAEYEKAVDLLLEHPDPDLPTLPAELYASIRSLDPTSLVAVRLAPRFASASVVGAEEQVEAPDLSLPAQPAGPVEAPDLSLPAQPTVPAEERVPFPDVNREAPAPFRFLGEATGIAEQEPVHEEPGVAAPSAETVEQMASPTVPAGEEPGSFYGGDRVEPSPMGQPVEEVVAPAPDLSFPAQPTGPVEAPDMSLAAQYPIQEDSPPSLSPEYRMAPPSQPAEAPATSGGSQQYSIEASPSKKPTSQRVQTPRRSGPGAEASEVGTNLAESLSGYLAAFGYFLINGPAEAREYLGEVLERRLAQASPSIGPASEEGRRPPRSRWALLASELGRKLAIFLGSCLVMAWWALSRGLASAGSALRSVFQKRPRREKAPRREEVPRQEEIPRQEEVPRQEEILRQEEVLTQEEAPVQAPPARRPTIEPVRTLPRARRARQRSYLALKLSVFLDGCLAAVFAVVRLVVFFLKVSLGIPLLIAAIAAAGWFGIEEKPESAFESLTQVPAPRAVQDPRKNGYFLLLGIGAGSSLDPLKIGYEKWQGGESARSNQCLDESAESRSSLRFVGGRHDTAAWMEASDPVAQFQNDTDRLAGWLKQHQALVNRYRQWLTMPFEDGGFGRFVTPECAKVLVAHRLYLAEGFSNKLDEGVTRLEKDLSAWRGVLGQAKTLPLKVLATAAVNEDLAVLSALLNRRGRDSQTLPRLIGLARPLDAFEDSLRWPMQNEFLLAVKTVEKVFTWETSSGRPVWERALMTMPLPRQKTLNAYARYYEAAMRAVEIPNNRLPKLHDFARTPPRTPPDYFVNPINNILATSPEPNWDLYAGLVLETDARLRVVSLQARLREPSRGVIVSTRVANAGLSFYDPFTGFPMLWNAAKGRLYSVGRDGKDDDGDPKRDVGVTVLMR